MKKIVLLVLSVLSLLVTGCQTGSAIVTGQRRLPVPRDLVKIYLSPPKHYEVIGLVEASGMAGWTEQSNMTRLINELKQRAGRIGANGVLLSTTGEKTVGYAASYGSGLLVASPQTAKTSAGLAIFVFPDDEPLPGKQDDAPTGDSVSVPAVREVPIAGPVRPAVRYAPPEGVALRKFGAIPVRQSLAPAELRNVIRMALAARNWVVVHDSKDCVVGRLRHGSRDQEVVFRFTDGSIEVECWGFRIDKNTGARLKPEIVEGWVENLRKDIGRQVGGA